LPPVIAWLGLPASSLFIRIANEVEKPEEITSKAKAQKDLEEIGWEDVNCIDLDDREKRWAVVHAVMNFGIP